MRLPLTLLFAALLLLGAGPVLAEENDASPDAEAFVMEELPAPDSDGPETSGVGASAVITPPRSPAAQPEPPRFRPIYLSVQTDRYRYRTGDPVRVTVQSDADAWVFIFSTDSMGVTRQLVPSRYERGNHVRRGFPVSYPTGSSGIVASTPGQDILHVFALPAWAGPDQIRWPYSIPNHRDPMGALTASPELLRDHFHRELRRAWENLMEEFRREAARDDEWVNPLTETRWIPWLGEGYARIHVEGDELRHGRAPYTPPPLPAPPTIIPPPDFQLPGRPTPPGYDFSWPYPPRPPWTSPIRPGLNPGQAPPTDNQRTGPLYVNAAPGRAEVYINGVYRGQTPYNTQLREGRYTITVYREGYIPWEREVRIRQNASNRYSVRLQPATGYRWY